MYGDESVPCSAEDVMREVSGLTAQGYREVMLLGKNEFSMTEASICPA